MADTTHTCNNLDHVEHLCSEISQSATISSEIGGYTEVVMRYSGISSDNILVEVDSKEKTIYATMKQNKFATMSDFPEVGSDRQIYVDLSDRSLWIYDIQSGMYANVYKRSAEILTFENIKSLVDKLNSTDKLEINKGASLYIKQLNVPDFWVYEVNTISVPYEYTNDTDLINEVKTNGSIQVGYYEISLLESEKVDLTEYATIDFVNTLVGPLQEQVNSILGIIDTKADKSELPTIGSVGEV